MVELSAQASKHWQSPCLRTIVIIVLVAANISCTPNGLDFWVTPDQQGERLFADGDYARAAQRFTDPMRVGAAWYRAGEFERAVTAFGLRTSADAHFNRGNALIMLGRYEQALAAFDLTLEQRPDWQPGLENRAIAVARLARLAPPEDDAGGTGGMLEADEIVFDTTGRVNQAQGEETIEADAGLTDVQLRELWLRRVATRPADFLRARFAVQLARQSEVTP